MSKYKPYPKYKDSGVEWLGQVPEEWALLPVKRCVTRLSRGKAPAYVDLSDVAVVNQSCIQHGRFDTKKIKFHDTSVSIPDELLCNADILINSTGGGTIGRVCFFNENIKSFADSHVTVLRCANKCFPKYIYYFLSSRFFYDLIINELSQGSTNQMELSRERLAHALLTLPSLSEQKIISDFLDHEISHIDTIISKQQHLIDLLEEKRISIISHAVNKGLDPDAPMKDSGIGWIGTMPRHWALIRTKRLFTIKKRIVGTLDFDVLSITQKGIQVKDLEANTGQFSMDYSKYQLVERGDFAMNHMDLLTGFVDISNYEGVTSPDYRVFSLLDRKNHVALYFLYIFQNAYLNKIFYSLGQGVSHFGRWRLQTEQFNDFVLPVPPKDEQKAIVDYLEDELFKIDATISKTRQAIALAQERRAAIISAAVTGKICVSRPQSAEKPLSKSLEYFQKVVLAAEITSQLYQEKTFGRVKLQKILYLSEYHAQLPFQRSEYQRYAAGPHDPKAMYSIEGQMKKQKWFDSRLRESGYGKEYVPLERYEAYKQYYERYFADKHSVIQRIIDLLHDKKTQFCEIIATLYGVWNDFLLEGRQPSDEEIVHDVVTNWDPKKQAISEDDWHNGLNWMRDNDLVPSGWGEQTIHRREA